MASIPVIWRSALLLVLSPALFVVTAAEGQTPGRNALGNPSPAVFEGGNRHKWQRPEWVIDQLGLKPTDIVADIGAGSGYFSRRLAGRLTKGGKVIAVDIDPEMLAYVRESAAKEGITNIETLLVETDSPGLDPGSVDLIFLNNTLHHIHNRAEYYKHMVRALRPGGRIVNIDFYKRDLPVGPRSLNHKLGKDTVLDEFTRANLFVTHDLDGLPHQYFLIARPLPSIRNAILLDARTISAGTPSTEQLGEIADLGFKTVVNLQTDAEGIDGEEDVVKSLGLTYVHIPIISTDIRDDQIRKFSETLTNPDNYPMLIHCRSANRVGGLLLLHQVLNKDVDVSVALPEARRAGLKARLEKLLILRLSERR